jgi:ATP-binding cassette subfamily C protein CydD
MAAAQSDALNWLRAWQAPARPWINAAIAAGLVTTGLAIVQAWWLADLLATAALTPAQLDPGAALLVLLLILAARTVCAYWRHRAGFEAGGVVRAAVRRQTLDALSATARAQRPDAGAGTTLLLEQVEALDGYYAQYLPQRVLTVLVPLSIVAVVWPRSWIAALILLLTAPLIPLFMVLIGSRARAASDAQFEQLQRLGGHFLDLLRGLPTLKLLGAARRQCTEVAAAASDYRQRIMGVLRLAFLSAAVLELLASVSLAMLALYLGLGLLERLPLGPAPPLAEALFILLLAPEFYAPLRALGQHYHARAHAIAAAEALARLQPPVDAPRSRSPQSSARERPAVVLQFSDVHVSYPDGRVALSGVDLHVPAGSRIALTGSSGAGKTTLLDLALGLLKPTRGRVRINGADVPSADSGTAPAAPAWIGQHPEWFSGSIRDNIRLGRPDADDAEVEAAAQAAGVSAYAQRLPCGLDTRLGENGLGLSGGELQRIAIARALLRRAALWVLDEPTAHLDRQTEFEIFATLAEVTRGRTVLLATHRLPPPDLTERVVALAQGRVLADCPRAALDGEEGEDGAGMPSQSEQADEAPFPPGLPAVRTSAVAAAEPSAARLNLTALARPHRRLLVLATALGALTVAAGVGLLAVSGWFLAAAAVAGATGAAAVFDIFRPGALGSVDI